MPVEVGEEAYLLTVSVSRTGLEQIMARIHAATAMALLVALGLIGLISLSLSSGITAPLVRMSRMARRMAEGDLDQQVEVAGNDEVADLAASFNNMAERIRQAMNALAEEKGKLETVLAQMADGIIVHRHARANRCRQPGWRAPPSASPRDPCSGSRCMAPHSTRTSSAR